MQTDAVGQRIEVFRGVAESGMHELPVNGAVPDDQFRWQPDNDGSAIAERSRQVGRCWHESLS